MNKKHKKEMTGYRSDSNANEGDNLCSRLIVLLSYILVAITFPFSVIFCIKVVQEYERAVSGMNKKESGIIYN